MKNFFLLMLVSISGFQVANAQTCENYHPMKVGAFMELTRYDADGKQYSPTTIKVTEQSNDAGNLVLSTRIFYGDDTGDGMPYSEITCANGELRMDMKPLMVYIYPKIISMESSDVIYPSGLEVGMSLPDAFLKVDYYIKRFHESAGGYELMPMMIHTYSTNRHVTGRDTITTPAGTFPCILIEEDMVAAIKKNLKKADHYHIKGWYALNIGVVKTERYQEGKLFDYQILTRFSEN